MATFPKGCAMIFGGSGGIGAGITRTFAQAGADLAIVYRSRQFAAEEIANEARGLGRKDADGNLSG